MPLRSRLLQSGKAAHARHPEGKSANAIKVCAMNATHPPGPPITLRNMRGGAARSASSETNGRLISLRACLTVFCAGERRMIRKGYGVALADVSDPEGYKLHVAENAK